METKFERHNKYRVLKHKDIETYLDSEQQSLLATFVEKILSGRLSVGKVDQSYVCVAADWPIYEQVWRMIEDFICGNPNEIEQLRQQLSAAQADSDQLVKALNNLIPLAKVGNYEGRKEITDAEALATHKARQQGKETT